MKKRIPIIGVVFLFLFSSAVPISIGQDVNISHNNSISKLNRGNTLYVGGSGPNNYTRIQDAINDSMDSDTVFVYDDSSPYFEKVIVNKSINLIGEDRNTTIIDGEGTGSVVNILSAYVTLTGFKITGAGSVFLSTIRDSGVNIRESDIIIHNNDIVNNGNIGIVIWSPSSNVTISYNIIVNNKRAGVYQVELAGYNKFLYNYFEENGRGIEFLGYKSTDENEIRGNLFINNTQGIELVRGNYNMIRYNEFDRNDIGLNLNIGMGYDISGGRYNIIEKNNFLNNDKDAFVKFTVEHFYSELIVNKWLNNYWRPRKIFPNIIPGKLYLYIFIVDPTPDPIVLPCFNIDWHPAKEPYDIPIKVSWETRDK